MRPCISLAFLCSAVVSTASSALAGNEADIRQKLFETDKTAALAAFDSSHQKACVEALQSRYQSQYSLSGDIRFNEPLSLYTYDTLFWQGKGNLQRGLIFSGSVTDQSGARAGRLMCFYAMTDHHLSFQDAYVLPVSAKAQFSAYSSNPLHTASNAGGLRHE